MKAQQQTLSVTPHQRPRRTVAVVAALLLAVLTVTTACTTASYGNKFAPDSKAADQYSFKIYTGGSLIGTLIMPPDSQAEKRIKEFMIGREYLGYEIIDRRYNLIPSYYEYTVRFSM